jgi:RNA polymerase sigma factor for flagellar operon FliA
VARLTERQQQLAFRRRVGAERLASLAPGDEALGQTDRLLQDLGAIGVGIALGLILEGTGMVQAPDAALPAGAYERLELRQLHARLWGLVGGLDERERLILERHYRDGRRFDEVAADLGLSKGRISQLHRQALTKLRNLLTAGDGCDVAF